MKGVLDFVTEIADTAGVSFVGKIAPFAPLIIKGMDLLAGQSKDVGLEIGLDTALTIDMPRTHAIIAVPKKNSKIDPDKLSIDPSDQKLVHNGQPVTEAYCVFSVRRTEQKADFGEIPISQGKIFRSHEGDTRRKGRRSKSRAHGLPPRGDHQP